MRIWRATRTEGREGDNLSYRGFFDYNADRFGVQVERLVVEPNFLPEIGFVRRTDMRRNFAQARYNLRPTSIRNLRRITTQASLNYVTNNQNRLDTREGVGLLQVELTNSDVASVTYTDNFDRLVRPFAIATGVTIPIGAYTFHTTRIGYIAGQQRRVSGEVVVRDRSVLQRRPHVHRRQRRTDTGHAAAVARAERLDQPGRSRAGFVHRQGRPDPHHLHHHATNVRQRAPAVQLREHVGRQQPPVPLGVSAWKRALCRLYRRLRLRPARRRGGASQPCDCREVQPAVPAVATWAVWRVRSAGLTLDTRSWRNHNPAS